MLRHAKRAERPNLRVVWPPDDPFRAKRPGNETVCRYGRLDGRPLRIHVWDGPDRPDADDAVYVPERRIWVAARIG